MLHGDHRSASVGWSSRAEASQAGTISLDLHLAQAVPQGAGRQVGTGARGSARHGTGAAEQRQTLRVTTPVFG